MTKLLGVTVVVDNALPEGTVIVVPERHDNEAETEWLKRFVVINNVGGDQQAE